MPHKDQKYIIALQNNNEALIKEIKTNCFGSLKKHVLKNSGNLSDAEDLFQTSLTIVWETVRKKEVEMSTNFCGYFYGFYSKIWLNILRERGKMPSEEIKDIKVEEVENELSLEDRRLIVFNECLNKLSESCQKLYKLQFAGKSAKQIVQLMNISNANAVFQRKFDCNKRLKKIIEEHPDFDTLQFNINT